MTSPFDIPVDRQGTHSYKWSGLPADDAIPLCVADMDFRSPEAVVSALRARAEHGVFGYTRCPESAYATVAAWAARRYGWHIETGWIGLNIGVVTSLCTAIRALTQPGDEVIIQTPVYHPFFTAVRHNGRVLVENRLRLEDGAYRMDFDALAEQAKTAKLLLLCNPHNPVGRVWTPDELTALGRICLEHGVTVVSDDIHCDLTLTRPHRVFADLDTAFAAQTITCLAPSKTFNIAGLGISYEVIPNPELRAAMAREKAAAGIGGPSLFGLTALEAAYRDGDGWLDALRDYLRAGLALVRAAIAPLDKVRLIEPEGTYLAWLDCRALGLSSRELAEYLLQRAHVRLIAGRVFGEAGEGFLRMNYGTSHATLRAALARLTAALDGLARGERP